LNSWFYLQILNEQRAEYNIEMILGLQMKIGNAGSQT